jgi:hypothetical protein
MRKVQLAVAAVVVGLLCAGQAAAQGSVATYTKEAMDDLIPLLNKASKDGFTMEPRTTTIFGGWLPKGSKTGNEAWIPVLTLKSLDPNKQYRIVASGDNDTVDLDLRIVDPSNGKVVAQDTTVLRDAEVTFRPARQQDYVIQLRLYDSRDNCVCLGAILRK